MRLDTTQQMRTEMRLRMAPRMIQSMEILQLPLMALQERIDQELIENPVLEVTESVPGELEAPEDGAPAAEATTVEEEPEYNELEEEWAESFSEAHRPSR